MTVNEAISKSATLFPADFDTDAACVYLSEIESRISRTLFSGQDIEITAESGQLVLIAPDAFAQIYPRYIVMRRELAYGDADRYAFYSSVFEQVYSEYASYVCRTAELKSSTPIKNI